MPELCPETSMNSRQLPRSSCAGHQRGKTAKRFSGSLSALAALSVCLVVLFFSGKTTLAAVNDEASLREILESVANTPLVRAPFIAIKSSGLLSAPVESRGTLSFSTDGLIEKHTTSPIDERTTISVEAIRIERTGQEVSEFRFADNPGLTAYAQGLRAIMGGDAGPLREHFDLSLVGDPAAWALTLRPKSGRLQSAVSSLEVTGANGLIKTIETVEASGDIDTLTILQQVPSTPRATPSQ